MESLTQETLNIHSSEDIVMARQRVRAVAVKLGFSVVNQTKIITAASELARNNLDYGGGGNMSLEEVKRDSKIGIRLIFSDNGPGIPDLTLAMTNGYTTGGGLGLGLSGAKRLVSEFEIDTEVGKGTRVSITQWK